MEKKLLLRLLFILIYLTTAEATVSVIDTSDEGQTCFKITTKNAQFYLQKEAGAFSSIVDNDGKDWVSFNHNSGAAGMYRGVPNLVHPGDIFHPGYTHCTSSLISSTSDKVVILAKTKDSKWEVQWEFYTMYATMTVLKSNGVYWFLYEGTPNESFNAITNYWMVSDETKGSCGTKKAGDIPSPEWICFGDNSVKRVFFLLHHEDDDKLDHYRPMNPMTVFGFGRDSGVGKFLSGKNTFTIGFAETIIHSEISSLIDDIINGEIVSRLKVDKKIRDKKTETVSVNDVQAVIHNYMK